MKLTHALLLASSLAFFACGGDDDEDSPAGPSKTGYDCSVTDGIKIVSPAGGETFKVGDEITVVFGTNIDDSGFRITFKNGEEDEPIDLTEEAVTAKMDGKACNEFKVKLDADIVEPTSEGIIRIIPYINTSKGKNSKTFTIKK